MAFFKLCPAEALRCGRCPCASPSHSSHCDHLCVTPPPLSPSSCSLQAGHRLCPPRRPPRRPPVSVLSLHRHRAKALPPLPPSARLINNHHTAIRQQASLATALPPSTPSSSSFPSLGSSVLANRPPPAPRILPTAGRTLRTRRRRRNARPGWQPFPTTRRPVRCHPARIESLIFPPGHLQLQRSTVDRERPPLPE